MSERDAQRPEPGAFRCPGCRGALERITTPDGTFSGCAECGGMWIDNPAATAVMTGRLTPPGRAFVARVTSAVRAQPRDAFRTAPGGASAYREAPAAGPRACPVCRADLSQRRVPDPPIVVDLCAAHGTYFDHFELAALVSRVDERMWAAYHAAHQHAARAAWQAQYATGDAGLDELVSGFADVLRRL